jgi:hypothetical protein
MSAAYRTVQCLLRRIEKLAGALSTLGEEADRIAYEVSLLAESDIAACARKNSWRPADSLKSTPLPGGSYLVSIDGSEPVSLSPRLWRLLRILTEEAPVNSADDCLGWLRLRDVRLRLSKELGRKITKANLATIVWRLRCTLGKHSSLIQSQREAKLIRFALRRKALPQVVISA